METDVYIVVVGGGEVGHYLARILLSDGHEVLVLEKERRRTEFAAEELGEVIVRGDGCEARTLEEVGTGRADMLIAVTGDDEDNLVACQVAKHKFNVPRTIARIKNPRHRLLFEKLGVDATVSSTELILAHIERELPSHCLIPLFKLRGGELAMIEVKILPGSRTVGRRLGDFRLPEKSLILLIIGKDKDPQIPTPDTILEEGDQIVALTRSGDEDALRVALTGLG
ncbi:TrkA family potassium uptake protein [Dehalococcoidia bacterium]|nr:TrkA family potassium uptake protein [Dehalococcoidia bacterium]